MKISRSLSIVAFRLLALALCTTVPLAAETASEKQVLRLMGSRFEITAIHSDPSIARQAISAAIAEIRRIEALISSWDPVSQTSTINRNAGVAPVSVDRELYDLIYRSKKVSRLTGGIFDISYASIDKVWHYDGSMSQLPDSASVRQSVARINYENIILDQQRSSVFLAQKGMKIGFGAIGKGYAANRARDIMIAAGISSGVVNAGGDLISWGLRENGQPWTIGIADPANKTAIKGWLQISNMAVVTSGNYEKFVVIDGKRYGHIIHPKTGFPVSGVESVTIVCPDAELADALATAVFIMGEREGLALINRLKNVEGLIVNDRYELAASSGLDIVYQNPETILQH